MNGKDIFLGLKYVGEDLIAEAETAQFPAQVQPKKRPGRLRSPLLAAALIALTLLLVGCAMVYVMKMQDVKIAQSTEVQEYAQIDGTYVQQPQEVNINTLSLAGVKDTNAYKASADYYSFYTEYRDSVDAMDREGTLPEDFWEKETFSKTLQAKKDSIAQEYGLKPEGRILDFRTTGNLCDALGVDRLVQDNQQVSAYITEGWCHENGNFQLSMNFSFPEEAGYAVQHTSGILHWNWQDCFSSDYTSLPDHGDWVEKNYTTAQGHNVLILHAPSQESGVIFCVRDNALMSLSVTMNPETYSEDNGVVSVQAQHMTEEQMERIADSLDFAVNPRIPTQADVDNQPGIPLESTQNGYTIGVKTVETDGYCVEILAGITAPEDVELSTDHHILFSNLDMLVSETNPALSGSSHIGVLDDGDGKANTLDVYFRFQTDPVDGQPPYAKGSTWNLHLVDIIDSYQKGNGGYPVQTTLAEGEWLFPITFDDSNGDYRELELIQQPVQATATTGWYEDGTDAEETFTITSYKLRKFTRSVESDAPGYADFDYFNGKKTKVVMKDGTELDMLLKQVIDLDQVQKVVLADGTELPVPTEGT